MAVENPVFSFFEHQVKVPYKLPGAPDRFKPVWLPYLFLSWGGLGQNAPHVQTMLLSVSITRENAPGIYRATPCYERLFDWQIEHSGTALTPDPMDRFNLSLGLILPRHIGDTFSKARLRLLAYPLLAPNHPNRQIQSNSKWFSLAFIDRGLKDVKYMRRLPGNDKIFFSAAFAVSRSQLEVCINHYEPLIEKGRELSNRKISPKERSSAFLARTITDRYTDAGSW